MKRIGCLMICILLIFAGMPALAWGHPLDDEPFYDPASGVLSGTVFWTTDAHYRDSSHPDYIAETYGERYHLYSMNLETGEIRFHDMDDNYYLVYSDLLGVTVAKEENGILSLYQMDLEGNLKPVLDIELFSRYQLYRGRLPCTAYAYYDGWLYYSLHSEGETPLLLARVKADGTELFVYSDQPSGSQIALSPGGKLAWIEYAHDGREATTLIVQDPVGVSIVETPMTDDYEGIIPAGYPVWLDESSLLFSSSNVDETGQRIYSMHSFSSDSGIISPLKDSSGIHLHVPYGIWSPSQFNQNRTQLLLMEYLTNAEAEGTPCVIDMRTGKEYKLAARIITDSIQEIGSVRNRAVWYKD